MHIQENYIVHSNTAILDKREIKHNLQKFRLVLYKKQHTLWHKYGHSIQALVMGKSFEATIEVLEIKRTSYTSILVALGKISMSHVMDVDVFAYGGPRTLPQEIPSSSLRVTDP